MEIMIPRVFIPPRQSFFLFGPRGTGKSTWLKQNMPDAVWIDLLESDEFRSYSAKPERLKELVLASSERKTVVIDEIQKVPELLSVVHFLIEKKLGFRFILAGSSSRIQRQDKMIMYFVRAMCPLFDNHLVILS